MFLWLPPAATGLVSRRPGPSAPSSADRNWPIAAAPKKQVRHRPQSRSTALVVTLLLNVVAGTVRPSKLVLRQVPAMYVFGDSMLDVGCQQPRRFEFSGNQIAGLSHRCRACASAFLHLLPLKIHRMMSWFHSWIIMNLPMICMSVVPWLAFGRQDFLLLFVFTSLLAVIWNSSYAE
jgi:hypothetical protein